MGPPGRSMFIFIIIPKNATGRNKATQKTHTFCHNIKSAAGKSPPISRGAVRKRRRETGDFAVSRRQSALTTTKGACGSFPCASIKIARFLVQSSSAPGFWMEKAQRAAPQALMAWGAALRVLCVKILQQNRRFLMPPRLWRYIHCTEKGRRLFLHFGTENPSFSAQNLTIL